MSFMLKESDATQALHFMLFGSAKGSCISYKRCSNRLFKYWDPSKWPLLVLVLNAKMYILSKNQFHFQNQRLQRPSRLKNLTKLKPFSSCSLRGLRGAIYFYLSLNVPAGSSLKLLLWGAPGEQKGWRHKCLFFSTRSMHTYDLSKAQTTKGFVNVKCLNRLLYLEIY